MFLKKTLQLEDKNNYKLVELNALTYFKCELIVLNLK